MNDKPEEKTGNLFENAQTEKSIGSKSGSLRSTAKFYVGLKARRSGTRWGPVEKFRVMILRTDGKDMK